jgi:hypothetical protein
VAQAFGIARRYAEAMGISAIWIDDPDRLFDVEPWVRQGLIDQF